MKAQGPFLGDIINEDENSVDPLSATRHLDSNTIKTFEYENEKRRVTIP